MRAEVSGIITLIFVAGLFSIVIAVASFLIAEKAPDSAKVSVYECGFDPFESARAPFAIKFFLVGVLFIVFDLELSFVFP